MSKAIVALLLCTLVAGGGAPQSVATDLLIPGDEFRKDDLPEDPEGIWWVLHRPSGEAVLERLTIQVDRFHDPCVDEQADEESGRAVSVPDAADAILLLRGELGLSPGPVRTAFVMGVAPAEADAIEAPWGDVTVAVRHVVTGYRYSIEVAVGDRIFQLRSDEWQGDGHWGVRWIGDMNRDGWPDLLVDASHKYSVHTTRLFLSTGSGSVVEMTEAATFTHSAC